MPQLAVTDRPGHQIDADTLLIGMYASDDGPGLVAGHRLPRRAASHLTSAIAALGATGRVGEWHVVPMVPEVRARKVALVGFGAPTQAARRGAAARFDAEPVRRAMGAATRELTGTLAVVVPQDDMFDAAAEGAGFGGYAITRVPGRAEQRQPVREVTLSVGDPRSREIRTGLARAQALADAVGWARDLVNQPPNLLYPQSFIDQVRARLGSGRGALPHTALTVLDDADLLAGGFGGTVGVGQGSSRPPRLGVLAYTPPRPKARIALVGKGITFDSGGLSLKPAAAMTDMKSDMAGAAAVAATIEAAARIGIPVAVTGYLALAENLPSGTAQRPSDVVTMRNGTTVEVLDTDAEGRMVLADAIAYASESAPEAIIDIATLTGAQIVALGELVAAAMGNDDTFRARVVQAADTAGEAMWPMPLPRELRAELDCQVADLAHKGERFGGMLTAGLFLSEFVGTTPDGALIPWAHLDIAGPSWAKKAHDYTPKGGTGYGVRSLVALLESYA